jgi:glucoamylase
LSRGQGRLGGIVVSLLIVCGLLSAPAFADSEPGATSHWTTGAKQGVGTSTTTASKVWYTLANGALSEVYYPRVDVANARSSSS